MQMRIVKFTVTSDGFDTSCKMTIINVFKSISVSFNFSMKRNSQDMKKINTKISNKTLEKKTRSSIFRNMFYTLLKEKTKFHKE